MPDPTSRFCFDSPGDVMVLFDMKYLIEQLGFDICYYDLFVYTSYEPELTYDGSFVWA